jgi:anti-sigma regulatory factor (Ser/Thr protein kinase)
LPDQLKIIRTELSYERPSRTGKGVAMANVNLSSTHLGPPDSAGGTGLLATPTKGDITPRGQGVAPACLMRLTAGPTAPGQARHFAARALRRWQAPAEAIQGAEIIVSELVTNAYRATIADTGQPEPRGKSKPGRIFLALSRIPGQVVIEVYDHSPDLPARSDADADADNGRGLVIVQAYSEQWGCRRTPSGGKVVYAILSVPGKDTEQEGQP